MSNESNTCKSNLALIYGSMLARLWLAVRAIQTGVEKFTTTKASDELVNIDGKANDYGLTASEAVKEYGLSHYHGVPEGLLKKFQAEPLLDFTLWTFDDPDKSPITLLSIYGLVLGPALLLFGVAILLGIAYRTSLLALGLLYISLTWGLILLGDMGSPGVAWLGTHMVLIVMALMLAEHNRLTVPILKKW